MKRALMALPILLVLILVFSAPAHAAEHMAEADVLHELGLLLGTGDLADGYALDRAPTRMEAGIMLLRLLGRYDEAGRTGGAHPFTDVPAWGEPYVGYLYEHGLTNGISETLYAPERSCSLQMYAAFVLRALGYDSGGAGLTYDTAIELGLAAGIIDPALTDEPFLRDGMAAISYRALFTRPGDGHFTTLLEKLTAEGAVSPTAGARHLAQYGLYQEILGATEGSLNSGAYDITVNTLTEMTLSAAGRTFDFSSETVTRLQKISSPEGLSLACTQTVNRDGEALVSSYYVKDGMFYVNHNGEKHREVLPASSPPEFGLISSDSAQISGIAFAALIDGIEKRGDDEGAVYAITLSAAAVSRAASGLTGQLPFQNSMHDLRAVGGALQYTVDGQGRLVREALTLTFALSMSVEGAAAPGRFSLESLLTVNALGGDVSVPYPAPLRFMRTA